MTVVADGGGVTIDPVASETINGLATLIVPDGTTTEIVCDGTGFLTILRTQTWASLGAAFIKGVTGYFKLPDGHIVQYGTGINPGVDHSVTLPIAFPTAFRAVIVVANGVTLSGLPNNTLAFAADVSTLSVFNVRPRFVNNSGSVGVANQSYYWVAIGY